MPTRPDTPATATPQSAAGAFRPPLPQAIAIPGPAGGLEARLEDPLPPGARHSVIGVVCHPHPLHGGTMQNKVVHTAARAMQECGAATVRFNFRGVGQSEGRYDSGAGELDDAVAVIDWARERFGCESFWLAGFSFGSAVALQVAARYRRPQRLVTIAPPVGRIITTAVARPECPWLIVQGDQDELLDVQAVQDWAARYQPAPQLLVVRGAEHFFHGRLGELRSALVRFMRGEALPEARSP
jgi:alpha/beta superfamily hydrolase